VRLPSHREPWRAAIGSRGRLEGHHDCRRRRYETTPPFPPGDGAMLSPKTTSSTCLQRDAVRLPSSPESMTDYRLGTDASWRGGIRPVWAGRMRRGAGLMLEDRRRFV
jgi:hypothetical protein